MGAFDDVVGAGVNPEVDVSQGAERIVLFEAGKADDGEAHFTGLFCSADDVGGFSAGTDEDDGIPG